MAMKMSLAMPLHDIMAYRKIARAYFSLLDVLCHNHVPALAEGDGRTFAFVVSSLEAGLRSLEVVVSSQCASAVDNLAGYYFKHVVAAEETPSPTAQVQSHLRPIARLWHICTRCRRMSQRLQAHEPAVACAAAAYQAGYMLDEGLVSVAALGLHGCRAVPDPEQSSTQHWLEKHSTR